MTFNPFVQPPVDYILLAGQKSPGLAAIDQGDAERIRDYAVRQPPFTSGARIVFKRIELAEFSVRIRLLTADHFAEWEQWRPVIDTVPDVRREAKALDIWHPLLEDLDIKAVVIKSVSQLVQTNDGEWTCTIKFLESRGLPKISLAPIEGAKATPADPVDQLIDRLAGQVEELAGE